MSKKKLSLIILATIILLSMIFGVVDYYKIKNGKMPIFVVEQIDKSGPDISYYGIFYKIVRSPGVSYKQDIKHDNYVKFGSWFYTKEITMKQIERDYISKLEVNILEDCDNKIELYYTIDKVNIYTYCADNIKVINKNNSKDLKDFLNIDKDVLDIIISQLTNKSSNDLGSVLYEEGNYNLLKCKITNDKYDIYIGNKDISFDYCITEENKTFTRTYQILNIAESNDEEYLYLTIREFQAEEVETVKVKKQFIDFTEDKYYEFRFKQTIPNIEDNLKSIFDNCTIISIQETDRTGLNQNQDAL